MSALRLLGFHMAAVTCPKLGPCPLNPQRATTSHYSPDRPCPLGSASRFIHLTGLGDRRFQVEGGAMSHKSCAARSQLICFFSLLHMPKKIMGEERQVYIIKSHHQWWLWLAGSITMCLILILFFIMPLEKKTISCFLLFCFPVSCWWDDANEYDFLKSLWYYLQTLKLVHKEYWSWLTKVSNTQTNSSVHCASFIEGKSLQGFWHCNRHTGRNRLMSIQGSLHCAMSTGAVIYCVTGLCYKWPPPPLTAPEGPRPVINVPWPTLSSPTWTHTLISQTQLQQPQWAPWEAWLQLVRGTVDPLVITQGPSWGVGEINVNSRGRVRKTLGMVASTRLGATMENNTMGKHQRKMSPGHQGYPDWLTCKETDPGVNCAPLTWGWCPASKDHGASKSARFKPGSVWSLPRSGIQLGPSGTLDQVAVDVCRVSQE